jgi:hypothetical protein
MPQRAMVIELGVTQVLKRQMPHSFKRGVYPDRTRPDLFEHPAQLVLRQNSILCPALSSYFRAIPPANSRT